MKTVTLSWVVTYRLDNDSPQSEVTKFTQESANRFAAGIIADGGVAVVTEDSRVVDSPDDDEHPMRKLQW